MGARQVKSIKQIFLDHTMFTNDGKHCGGTDRQSNHNYGDAYEGMFQTALGCNNYPTCLVHTKRNEVKLMIEVGTGTGYGLLAWSEIFPNATCVGLDIQHPPPGVLNGKKRIEFYDGSMTCSVDCNRAVAGRKFDLIVDDASHLVGDSLTALLYLWPSVREGGIYVIEEFGCCEPGGDNYSMAPLLKQLFPSAQVINTAGPFGFDEPLVILKKQVEY